MLAALLTLPPAAAQPAPSAISPILRDGDPALPTDGPLAADAAE